MPRPSSTSAAVPNGQGVPQDYAEAVNWYRKAADQGNADAQSNLGWMYCTGRGVPQDDAEAVSWYRKAADQGNAAAQSNLGWMYANGRACRRTMPRRCAGTARPPSRAMRTPSSTSAVLYGNGRGVPQDYAEAVSWYRKAAEQGDARGAEQPRRACTRMARACRRTTPRR